MGYLFAHLHIGEEVLKLTGHETRPRKSFNFGTVGPDFAYALSPETEKTLHDESALSLAGFFVENANKGILLDYAIGYATHVIADIEMYPVIMKYAENDFEKYIRLSLVFDYMLAKREYGISIEKVNIASKINIGRRLPDSLGRFIKKGVKEIYGMEFDASRAYEKFLKFLEFTFDPFLVKRMFYPVLSRIAKIDLNLLTYPARVNEKQFEGFYEETLNAMRRGIKESATYILVKKSQRRAG